MIKDFSTGSFIGGFLLGALVVGAWLLGSDTLLTALATPPAAPAATAAQTSDTTSGSGALSVTDQKAGDSVTVESVTVPPPGVWVAVREMSGGDLGNVLGAFRVSGPRSNVVVPLLRATEPGLSYAVELYRDDSDAFDPTKNSVYVDFASGAPVISYFNTTK